MAIDIIYKLLSKQSMSNEESLSQIGVQLQCSAQGESISEPLYICDQNGTLKQKQIQLVALGGCQSPAPEDGMLPASKEGLKKMLENKVRYKKLKQRLNFLCQQIQEQGFFKDQKDTTSPNKSRLVKLALELQKSLKTQAIDYQLVESHLKEIQKILEYKREHDILILRGARLMSTIFTIIKRFPSLHRNEAQQSANALEMSIKILKIMLTLRSSRQYLLISNQLMAIDSLLNCALMREDKKTTLSCISIFNLLVAGPNRIELDEIIKANIEYILYSSLLKKLKTYLETCLQQDDPSHSQLLLSAFKFYYFIVYISCQKELQKPIYFISPCSDSISKAIIPYFDSGIQLLTQSIIDLLFEKEGEGEENYFLKQQQPANFKINLFLYIFKSLNLIFHSNTLAAQKSIECSPQLMEGILHIFEYVKQNFKQSIQNTKLCSQIIIFIGNLTFQNFHFQEIIRTSGILSSLCNHPLEYFMDATLSNILIPTFCCVIYENSSNFKAAFSQNSAEPILKYIQKEIFYHKKKNEEENTYENTLGTSKNLNCPILSRKNSVSSINSTYSKASMAESFSTQTSNNIGLIQKQIRLEQKFRPEYWQKLIFELRQIED